MELLDFILHVDDHLLEFITNYGIWIYGILFLIIFVETGLVVMPFLPGDSLLFASGALAASTGAMDPWVLIPLLFTAAVLGDTLNYHIGKYIGPRVFEIESRFINKTFAGYPAVLCQTRRQNHYFCPFHSFCTYLCTFCCRCGKYELQIFPDLQYDRRLSLDQFICDPGLSVWQHANRQRQLHSSDFRHHYFKCHARCDWLYSAETQEK